MQTHARRLWETPYRFQLHISISQVKTLMKRLPISSLRYSLLALCMAAAAAQAATQTQILDAALVTGDSSQLTDSHLVAQRLQQQQNQISQKRSDLLSQLYST